MALHRSSSDIHFSWKTVEWNFKQRNKLASKNYAYDCKFILTPSVTLNDPINISPHFCGPEHLPSSSMVKSQSERNVFDLHNTAFRSTVRTVQSCKTVISENDHFEKSCFVCFWHRLVRFILCLFVRIGLAFGFFTVANFLKAFCYVLYGTP